MFSPFLHLLFILVASLGRKKKASVSNRHEINWGIGLVNGEKKRHNPTDYANEEVFAKDI
jgi:hypothetical protein